MPNLKFKINDSEIVKLLGQQNFTNQYSALLELIKNGYDAGATFVNISISDKIIITDDGCGMSEDDIYQKWMTIGDSSKEYIEHGRVLAGNKGIGRLALSYLGKNIRIESKTKEFGGVQWNTNGWNEFHVSNIELEDIGTKIIINSLNQYWGKEEVLQLNSYLCRIIKGGSDFVVNIIHDNNTFRVSDSINAITKENYQSKISFNFDLNSGFEVKVCESIFDIPSIESINPDYSPEYEKTFSLDELSEIIGSTPEVIKMVGPFEGVFYWGVQKGISNIEKLKYNDNKYVKAKIINDEEIIDKYADSHFKKYKNKLDGVILYRNKFSVSGYDGSIDWLGLHERVERSPATQTHPSGKYQIRHNNICGYVDIDKSNNPELKDLSNRQGLENNINFDAFKKILIQAIALFETEYQENCKLIDQSTTKEVVSKSGGINAFLNSSEYTISKELKKDIKDEIYFHKKKVEEYSYDISVFEQITTNVIKTQTLTHDYLQMINTFQNKPQKLYDILLQQEDRLLIDDNMQDLNPIKICESLIVSSSQLSEKLSIVLGTASDHSSKDISTLDIEEEVNQILSYWSDNAVISPVFDISIDSSFKISRAALSSILDNLISNSINHNFGKKVHIVIMIEVGMDMSISYCDNGVGIHPKFKKKPSKIMDIFVTTSKNGHGIGMWIVKSIVNRYDGDVYFPEKDEGFHINIILRRYNEL